jgi:hypothetical protein
VRLLTLPLALVLGAACALLVACGSGGGDDLIPANRADAMQQRLDRIAAAVSDGSCTSVDNDLSRLQQQINALSSSVAPALRQRLQEGVNNLAQIAPEACLAQSQSTQTTPTETVPPETTPTQTTPTETTPTETTPTETTPPVETTPVEPAPAPPTDTGTDGGATIPQDPGAAGGATPTTP